MDEKDFCKKLGSVLKAARVKRTDNMSQYRLAESAGLTRRYVQMLENGRQGVTLLTLFSLAKALEVPPVQLIEQLDYAVTNNQLPGDVLAVLPPKKIGRPKKSLPKTYSNSHSYPIKKT